MKLGYARVSTAKRPVACHMIEHGPAGIWRGSFCGTPSISSHGGILTATCKRCLAIALRRLDPGEFAPGVFKKAVRRARRLGVRV